MKRIIRFIAAPLLVLAMIIPTFASSPGIMVNNKNLPVSGISKEGRVLVPLRAIFESLNATVDYDFATKTITGNQNGKIIILKINDKVASVNGEKIELDVPATIVKGATLVPVRFIGESLGAIVDWNNNTVLIKSGISSPEEIELVAYEKFMLDYGVTMLMRLNAYVDSVSNIVWGQGTGQELQNNLLWVITTVNDFVAYEGPVPDKYAQSHKAKLLIIEEFKKEADLMLIEMGKDSEKLRKYMDDQPEQADDHFSSIIDPLTIFMIHGISQINMID